MYKINTRDNFCCLVSLNMPFIFYTSRHSKLLRNTNLIYPIIKNFVLFIKTSCFPLAFKGVGSHDNSLKPPHRQFGSIFSEFFSFRQTHLTTLCYTVPLASKNFLHGSKRGLNKKSILDVCEGELNRLFIYKTLT